MMIGRRDVVGIALIAGLILTLGVCAWGDCPGGVTGKTPCGPRCGHKVPITCQQSSDGLFAPDGCKLAGKCQYAGTCRYASAGCSGQCGRGGANSPAANGRQSEVGCPVCAKAVLVMRPLRDGSVGLKVAVHVGAKSCLALVLYGKDGVPIAHPDVLSASIEGEHGSTPIALQPTRHAWHGCFDAPVGGEYTVVVHARILGGATETAVFPVALSSVTPSRVEAEDKAGNSK